MLSALLSILSFIITSIHGFSFQDSQGSTIQMSSFSGKKIMLVNIATGSSRVGQLEGLQQLHQQYGDSLVIIAFPSNSFGSEQRSDAEIRQYCQNNYGCSFVIASKIDVLGSNIHPIYNWLSKKQENGDLDIVIGGDFQKIIIAQDGTIQGIFSAKLEPQASEIITAINTDY